MEAKIMLSKYWFVALAVLGLATFDVNHAVAGHGARGGCAGGRTAAFGSGFRGNCGQFGRFDRGSNGFCGAGFGGCGFGGCGFGYAGWGGLDWDAFNVPYF